MCPDLTLSGHAVINAVSLFVFYINDPFGAIHNPNILEA